MKHVLVVDDDSTHRISLQTLLEEEGYRCNVAENGGEALAFLKRQSVDLVLTDHNLPIINGIQLIEHMSHADFPIHPPSILLTGQLEPKLAQKAEQAGAFVIFRKPYEIPDLLAAVAKALESTEESSSEGNQSDHSTIPETERTALHQQVSHNGKL